MCAFADDQTTIVWTIGEDVDEALQAAEAVLGWVLV